MFARFRMWSWTSVISRLIDQSLSFAQQTSVRRMGGHGHRFESMSFDITSWILHGEEEEMEVNSLLLKTIPDDWLCLLSTCFWTQLCWIAVLISTGFAWVLVLIAVDLWIFQLRRKQRKLTLTATGNDLKVLGASMALTVLAWVLLTSLAVFQLTRSESVPILALGILLGVGTAGYNSSLLAAFPRLAITALIMLDGALTAGLAFSPIENVPLLALAAPMGIVTLSLLIMKTNRTLLESVRARHHNYLQSVHDPLTGLPNRLFLIRKAQELCQPGENSLNFAPFALLAIDLDGFKPVNDQFGHLAGDWVLKQTACRLLAIVRAGDVVCRTGGDEFVILLPIADENLVNNIANRILDDICQPIEIGARMKTQISASIGIASCLQNNTDYCTLLESADNALYAAKRDGKGRLKHALEKSPL